jgi:predicted NBD/HSP70 family sugar kinase
VVSVGNEANLAALAEYWYGTRLADFVQVSGEIGVGGGVVVGGRLFRGVRGFAGEIGHLPVDPCGPRCGCGNRGCLEQVAGRRAVLTAAQAHDEAELRWRAEAGDARTLGAFAETSRALAIALSAVVNTLDLPAVVLSGFYARVAPWLVEHLTAELNERVVSRAPVDVHVSDLGADAPMLGAAGQVIRRIIGTGALPLVGTPVV